MLDLAIQDAIDKGDYFDAIALLQAAVSTQDDPSLIYQLAINLQRVGHTQDALDLFDDAESKGFSDPMLTVNRGHAYKALGDVSAAEQAYRKALHGEVALRAIVYWSLADLSSRSLHEEDLAEIQKLLDLESTLPGYRALLLFARGNALDLVRNHEQAFADFNAANDILAQIRPFQGELYHKLINELMQVSSISSYLESDFTPVFIVGMPRSGTTLVEQILAAHSQVAATDELVKLGHLSIELEEAGGYAKFLDTPDADLAIKMQEAYSGAIKQYNGQTPYLIDKNPNNFLHIGLIKLLYPKAKIINVVRDPLDNAMGVYRRYFDKGYEFSYSLEGIIFHWQGYVSLMNHWNTLFPGQIYHLDYAKLASTPKTEISGLLTYCGLADEPACYDLRKSTQAVLTPSSIQVRQPISTKSLGAGLKYQKFLQPYLRQLAQLKLHSDNVFGFKS
ncbi:sulfotransferase [Aequoribacter sp.]|uniref:sulfotransferase family protein n=1 Tax=Aequoribacter sp. TaxID=2847771 RepID=UPI003F697342